MMIVLGHGCMTEFPEATELKMEGGGALMEDDCDREEIGHD